MEDEECRYIRFFFFFFFLYILKLLQGQEIFQNKVHLIHSKSKYSVYNCDGRQVSNSCFRRKMAVSNEHT